MHRERPRRREEGKDGDGERGMHGRMKERTIGGSEGESATRGAPMGRTILQEREGEREAVSRVRNVTFVSEQGPESFASKVD